MPGLPGCPYARSVLQCAARRPRRMIPCRRHFGKRIANVDAMQSTRMYAPHVWAAVRSEAAAEMWLLYSAPGCPHARSATAADDPLRPPS
jgi:hypothetical protein